MLAILYFAVVMAGGVQVYGFHQVWKGRGLRRSDQSRFEDHFSASIQLRMARRTPLMICVFGCAPTSCALLTHLRLLMETSARTVQVQRGIHQSSISQLGPLKTGAAIRVKVD